MSASLILDIEQFSLLIEEVGAQQAHRTPFKLAEAQRQPTFEAGAAEVHFNFSKIALALSCSVLSVANCKYDALLYALRAFTASSRVGIRLWARAIKLALLSFCASHEWNAAIKLSQSLLTHLICNG